jgi:hypothetical protein
MSLVQILSGIEASSYNELFGKGNHGSADGDLYSHHLLQESGFTTIAANDNAYYSPINQTDGTYTGFGGTLPTVTGPGRGYASAIDFSASEYIDIEGSVNYYKYITETNVFTLSFWLKLNSATTRQAIMGSALATSDIGWFVIFEYGVGNGTAALRFTSVKDSVDTIISARSADNVITDTNWHHVVIKSGSPANDITFYVDGVASETTYETSFTSVTVEAPTRTTNFGRSNHSSAVLELDGALSGISHFRDELTATEVDEVYDGPEPYFGSRPPAPTGTPAVGQTLTANLSSLVNPNNGTVTVAYQWYTAPTADGTPTDIPGATSSTYTIAAGDDGKFVGVKLTPSNTGGVDSLEADTRSTEVEITGAGPTFQAAWAGQSSRVHAFGGL